MTAMLVSPVQTMGAAGSVGRVPNGPKERQGADAPPDTGGQQVPSGGTWFGAVLAAVDSLGEMAVGSFSPSMPEMHFWQPEKQDGGRAQRLAALNELDVQSRTGGESRISGAGRLAMDTAAAGDERADGESSKSAGERQYSGRRVGDDVQGTSSRTPLSDQGKGRVPSPTLGKGGAPGERTPEVLHEGQSRSGSEEATSKFGNKLLNRIAGEGGRGQMVSGGVATRQTGPSSPAAVQPLRVSHAGRARPNAPSARNVTNVAGARETGGPQGRWSTQNGADPGVQARGKSGQSSTGSGVGRSKGSLGPGAEAVGARQKAMFRRIAKVVRASMGSKETVARIQLNPPALGQVRITMRLKNDTLQLRLVTETAEAREVLRSRIDELRGALEQQGLRVQRVDFPTPPRGDEGSAESLGRGQGEDPSMQADTGDRGADHHAGAEDVDQAGFVGGDGRQTSSDGDVSEEVLEIDVRLDIRV